MPRRFTQSVALKIVGLIIGLGYTHEAARSAFKADGEGVPSRGGIRKVLKRFREGKDMTGRKRKMRLVTTGDWLVLKAALDAEPQPRMHLREMQQLLYVQLGRVYSCSSTLRCIAAHGYTWKSVSYRAAERSIEERMAYLTCISDQARFDAGCAIFIDGKRVRGGWSRANWRWVG